MDTNTPSTTQAPGRTRRRYSKEFKAQLVAQAQVPGVSLASIAIGRGLNPNVVRRWVAEANDRARPSAGTGAAVAD
jgi:transposase